MPFADPGFTSAFSERYATDAEFKKQVDEGRKRAEAERTRKEVSAALQMVPKKQKLY